ncbi:hypothetical protein ACIQU7_23605 [Streptomyces albidoflavus]
MKLDRQAATVLASEGKAAYEQGDPSDACPYNPYGNADEQFSNRYWRRGWVAARSEAEAQQEERAAASTGQ